MKFLTMALFAPLSLLAQGAASSASTAPPADTEASRLADSCDAFKKAFSCATELFTDHPFHIGVSSLAPGNGFAAGPALSFAHHTVPKKIKGPDGDTITSWRLSWDVDAVASSNESWRAGAYLTARYTKEPPTIVVTTPPKNPDLRQPSWFLRAYAETDSLEKLSFYGFGQKSSRNNLTLYGMHQAIAGGNIETPRKSSLLFSAFAEANARIVELHDPSGPVPVQQIVSAAAATQGYAQFGEGVRITPAIQRLQFDYTGKMQEFVAPGASYTFERLSVDLNHTFGLYQRSAPQVSFNGPDSCDQSAGSSGSKTRSNCPKVGMVDNLEGSLAVRFMLNESYTPQGDSVPFYFQPTLGGGNINGDNMLGSFADYRFRAPNSMFVRGTFEHSLGKLPIGFEFMADAGRVSSAHDFSGAGWAHSFAAGLTVHAGGLPVFSVLFAFGGGEGTHTLAQVSNSLLGGGNRPSLY